jgi:hypothetical protein
VNPKKLALNIVHDEDHERARRRVAALCAQAPRGEPWRMGLALLEALEDLPQERHVLTGLMNERMGGPVCARGPWWPTCEVQQCADCPCRPAGIAGGAGEKNSE